MKIGIISPSEIAYRRFLPALQNNKEFEFVGVAVASKSEWFEGKTTLFPEDNWTTTQKHEIEKAKLFIKNYGGTIFDGYQSLIKDRAIDCIYVPLPPALHYKWANLGLEFGKHVFIEKPSTTCLKDTQSLVNLAKQYDLALHENYMFAYHEQLNYIKKIVNSGEIGDVRLYRISFGFPLRQSNDFRYKAELGGGALLDCGGYVLKYASMLLGDTTKLDYARLNHINGFEVDMYGSAALSNDQGVTAQIAFGMDNNYKCELEIWGSKGTFYTNRVLTAPRDFEPEAIIRKGNEETKIHLPADDTFSKSIQVFKECIINKKIREDEYKVMIRQEELLEEFKNKLK